MAAPAPPDDTEEQCRRRDVGLAYDSRMCPPCSNGAAAAPDEEYYGENADRIKAVWQELQSAGLTRRCLVLGAKRAEEAHVVAVHGEKHVGQIRRMRARKRKNPKQDWVHDKREPAEAAFLAAGAVLELARKVANGELRSGFAIVRPPGHLAARDERKSHCLLNNVAIAANFLLDVKTGLGIKKILIVDWDLDHGSGTQKIFLHDPRVLFFSVHRSDLDCCAGKDGSYTNIGEDLGVGYNINVPWNWMHGFCGDNDYLAIWDHILIPVAKSFNPDMVLVSGGFSGDCYVTPHGYSIMTRKLMALAQGKVVMSLEGGYDPSFLANCVIACVKALLDEQPITDVVGQHPLEATWNLISMVRQKLSEAWPVLAAEVPDRDLIPRSNGKQQNFKGKTTSEERWEPDWAVTGKDSVDDREIALELAKGIALPVDRERNGDNGKTPAEEAEEAAIAAVRTACTCIMLAERMRKSETREGEFREREELLKKQLADKDVTLNAVKERLDAQMAQFTAGSEELERSFAAVMAAQSRSAAEAREKLQQMESQMRVAEQKVRSAVAASEAAQERAHRAEESLQEAMRELQAAEDGMQRAKGKLMRMP